MKRAKKARTAKKTTRNRTVVIGLTGSIACYKMCDVISRLVSDGESVQCILTSSAKQFITPLTLASLSKRPVYEDQFVTPPFPEPIHTRLAREAQLIVIAPATANVISKMAAGRADDLLTATVLASRAHILVVPAMNENMWTNRFTQENIERLKRAGMDVLEPVRGRLVCQDEGLGHIEDPERITQRIKTLLRSYP